MTPSDLGALIGIPNYLVAIDSVLAALSRIGIEVWPAELDWFAPEIPNLEEPLWLFLRPDDDRSDSYYWFLYLFLMTLVDYSLC